MSVDQADFDRLSREVTELSDRLYRALESLKLLQLYLLPNKQVQVSETWTTVKGKTVYTPPYRGTVTGFFDSSRAIDRQRPTTPCFAAA